jgi:hypothetical protein
MNAASHAYENPVIGFRLEVPGDWELKGWKTSQLDRSARQLFQARDDDLPTKAGSSRFIVVARKYKPGSSAVVDCDIETSLFREPRGYDFLAAILGNRAATSAYYRTAGIESHRVGHGDWLLGEQRFSFVDQKNASQWGTSRYRFAFRPLNDTLWFYAKIAGHSEQAFGDALAAFATIRLAGSVVEPVA